LRIKGASERRIEVEWRRKMIPRESRGGRCRSRRSEH